MAGREELYLKHIDENTASIAKSLKQILDKVEIEEDSKDAYEEKCSVLHDFASYYSDYAITDNQQFIADVIQKAVEDYISLIGKEATK